MSPLRKRTEGYRVADVFISYQRGDSELVSRIATVDAKLVEARKLEAKLGA